MSDRTKINPKKSDTSTVPHPSLASPTTPTLANPTPSFGLELSNQQDPQSAQEQSQEQEAFKRQPLEHDISRISLRSQAKFSTSQFKDPSVRDEDLNEISMLPVQAKQRVNQAESLYEQQTDWLVDEVMPMQIPESNEAVVMRPLRESLSGKSAAWEQEDANAQLTPALPQPPDSIADRELSNQQDPLPTNEQLQEEAFKRQPLEHDISRISLHSQAKFSTSQFKDPSTRNEDLNEISMPVQAKQRVNQAGSLYEQQTDWLVDEVMPMQIPESNEAVVMRSLRESLSSKSAACEQKDDLIQRDETDSLQPPTNGQLTPALSQPPATTTTNQTAPDSSPSSDPKIQEIALEHLEEQLVPETIESALVQIDLSGLPVSDSPPNSSDNTTSTTNVYATLSPSQSTNDSNLILRQATPPTAASPAASPDPHPPQNATTGDLVRAIMAVPTINSGLILLRTQAKNRITQDWSRLNAGEQVAVVSTTVLIGAGALTGVFSNPETRRFALDKLNGQVLPVPGVNWLHLELNTGGNNLMLGMHLDIGQLLPSGLGFGASSPNAIGSPPQPQPLPGQRMIQRQEDGAETAAQGAIAQRIHAASGKGSKLDAGVEQHLEQHLGADLSNVRIHTDSEADRLSQSVNAVAFTTGQDIFFSSSSYNPTSTEGQHLIAHEVVHTVQQKNGAVAGTPTAEGVSISDPSDPFEQEAEQIADRAMQAPKPEMLGKASATSKDWLEPLVGGFPQNVQRQKHREADTSVAEESLTQLLAGQVLTKTESVDEQATQAESLESDTAIDSVQRRAKDEIVIQRSLVDDVFSYLRTGNTIADFVLGVVAGILEWVENLIRGVISLAGSLLELLAEADRGNIWASLGVIGLIVLIILACAFPEVSVPILVGVGIAVGALHLVYHIAMLFNPLISAYEKGKHLGKALIEGLLIVVSVLEILQFAKAFRTISELTEGAGAMQKIRWIMQLRRFGSIEASLAVLDEVKDVDKAIQLIELAKNSEKALELIRAERNINTLLEILQIEGITVDNVLRLLGKPGMTGSILRNFLRNADGSPRMTVVKLEQLLGHSKIAENVTLLQSLVTHTKITNLAQLEELLNNAKIVNGTELLNILNHTKISNGTDVISLLNNSKIENATEILSLLNHTKIANVTEIISLLNHAKIANVGELLSLLNHTKVTSIAELIDLLNNAKIANVTELLSLLNHTKITSIGELIDLLNNTKIANVGELLSLLNHAKITNVTDLLSLLNHTKVANLRELLDLLNHTKVVNVAEILSLLNHSKVTNIAELLSLLNHNKVTNIAEILDLLNHAQVTNVTEILNLLNNAKIPSITRLQELLNANITNNAAELERLLNLVNTSEDLELYVLMAGGKGEIAGLEAILNRAVAKGDVRRVEDILNLANGNATVFRKLADAAPLFRVPPLAKPTMSLPTPTPPYTGLTPNATAGHFLDHTYEYVDLPSRLNKTLGTTLWPPGTTPAALETYVQEAVNVLTSSTPPTVILPGAPQSVSISGFTVQVGTQGSATNLRIGQFFPTPTGGGIHYTQAEINALWRLLQ
ncbi:MAG: DUF4157 domain-containing protein [Nostoc sp. S4]|nr:DUF4157 domain-containing protein [Nostoc sp. S4]